MCSGLQDLSLQHISNILWAYVSFLQMREPVTSAFLEELRLRLRKATFNAQQLSNLLWSLCIAEVDLRPPPSCLAKHACSPQSTMKVQSCVSWDSTFARHLSSA